MELEDIVAGCIRRDPRSQAELVRRYAGKFKGISSRYVPDLQAADDIVQESFINIFRYIKDFKGTGHFEGWMRRIVVNASLTYRKKHIKVSQEIDNSTDRYLPEQVPEIYSKLDKDELMNIIKQLPELYYVVFNLYVIEGFDHREISKKLNIGESTSRSTLSRARVKLIELLKKTSDVNDYPHLKAI